MQQIVARALTDAKDLIEGTFGPQAQMVAEFQYNEAGDLTVRLYPNPDEAGQYQH